MVTGSDRLNGVHFGTRMVGKGDLLGIISGVALLGRMPAKNKTSAQGSGRAPPGPLIKPGVCQREGQSAALASDGIHLTLNFTFISKE